MVLPTIVRRCSADDREKLLAKVRTKVVAGKWRGAKNRRVELVRLYGMRKLPPLHVPATHVILCATNSFPTETKHKVAHLCNDETCMEHLQWSTHEDITKRRACHKAGICSCGLLPPCIMKE